MKTKQDNLYKTSDIKLSKDSVGYFTAEHLHHGILIDSCYFNTRTEARQAAVEELNNRKENEDSEDWDDYDTGW